MEEQLTASISSIFPARINLEMENADLSKVISTSPILRINDGVKTSIQNQGHGVQRSVIFSLIEVLGRLSAKSKENDSRRAIILLFEEPELFLHPHLMRRMKDSLKTISSDDHYQVILSTQSPIFINVADEPGSLIIFRKKEKVLITQLKSDPFAGKTAEKETLRATLNFHPTVCEAFFADRTVLVEGHSELAVLNHATELLEKYGISIDKIRTTTIVSCAGKWTIVPMAILLSAFKIDFRVVHDCDAKNKTAQELAKVKKNDPYAANARILETCGKDKIFVINDTLEHILFNPPKDISKDKPYRCWERAVDLSKNDTDRESLTDLKKLVEFSFNW